MKHWPIIKHLFMLLDFLYHVFLESYDSEENDKKK